MTFPDYSQNTHVLSGDDDHKVGDLSDEEGAVVGADDDNGADWPSDEIA